MTDSVIGLHEEIGRLKAQSDATSSEVHGIKSTIEKLFDKFDEFTQNHAPQPMGFASIMGVVVAGLSSLAIVFGCILYIVNSQTAPVTANISQLASTVQTVNTSVLQTANAVQLANKEITVVANRAKANEETLDWLLFSENLPKQITELRSDMDHLTQMVQGKRNDL